MVEKAWHHKVFGKDWFYRLFLAFGRITQEMIDIVNEVAEARRNAAEENALASSQGDLSRLSERSRARLFGLEVPPVRGINHPRSEPFKARAAARFLQIEYGETNKKAWEEYSSGRPWTQQDQEADNQSRQAVQTAWDHAEEISYVAGHEFFDRNGMRKNIGTKTPFVAEVVNIYLDRHGRNMKRLRA